MGEREKTEPKIMSTIELFLILFVLYSFSLLIPIFLSYFRLNGNWRDNLIGILILSVLIFLYCSPIIWIYLRRKSYQARMKYNFEKTGIFYEQASYVGKTIIVIITIYVILIIIPLVWYYCGPFIAILIICIIIVLFGTVEICEKWCKKKRLSRLYWRSLEHFYFWLIPWIFFLIFLVYYIITFGNNVYFEENNTGYFIVFFILVFFIPSTINLINSYILVNQIRREEK